ncbi:glutathione-disulfide reductase [Montanilutibacter psychrotolerans]|uniref:Glutathione-disulfide reductase n=1 Tax=Montanilutibacter psychrotolerans TaxID=1327343 RepID=A0A3M8SV60_9GAMM|nr:glutathione-disulfide reductase [Lysobacter psychrotolerans]RNF82592.1 glutathione-disulfide reductase [Lysobacter psychrotolerans]
MADRDTGIEFDLAVVGGGSGGLAGAFRAAEHGARVVLFEPDALGGTCVNLGCVPKKAMWLAADLAGRLRMAPSLGFNGLAGGHDGGIDRLDWQVFIAHRQRYISNIHAAYRRRLDAAGIVVRPSRARLVAADTLECDDGVRVIAKQVLLATGGHALRPDVPGAALGGVSDDFFAWRAAPERVAIVGGGYIAVELAGVLQALGSQVDLFVRGTRLLNGFDAQLCEQLAEDYRQHGVRVHFGYGLGEVESADGGGVRLRDATGQASERFDALLFATGRAPNSAGLGLDAVGVATDARGHVIVDARHATSVDGVHAVGDLGTDAALTPVAIAAARRLMDRLFGGRDALFDACDIATVVFSHPPIGKVGLTEAEARERHGDAVHVFSAGFRPMLQALAESPQRSLFKLVCVGQERRVIGIHLLGEAADEILQGFAVAMKRGITLDDLRDTVAIHPTSAEEVVLMR